MRLKLLLLVISVNTFVAATAVAAGTTSAAFLRLGIGARNVAMGETGAAGQDVTAAYWNPAGIDGIQGRSISFMHAVWFADISFQNAMYAQKLKDASVAVSATYLSMSEITKFDNTGLQQNDSYKPTDMALWVSYARQISEIPVGASLKYISSKIDANSASAIALDAGMMFKPMAWGTRKINAGIAVQNIGSGMKYRSESYGLPLNFKAGASCAFSDAVTAALDVNKPVDTDLIGNAGVQYQYPFGDKSFIAGRAGYRTNIKGLEGLSGLTAGFGFGYRGIIIDYAYVPYGDLDDTHRISLQYNF